MAGWNSDPLGPAFAAKLAKEHRGKLTLLHVLVPFYLIFDTVLADGMT